MATPVLYVELKNVPRSLVMLRRIIANIPQKTDKEVRSLFNKSRELAILKIQNETDGLGLLESSIYVDVKDNVKSKTYSLRTTGEASEYSQYVDEGFEPHLVSVRDKLRLQQWISKNLGAESLLYFMNRNVMAVGYSTPWNQRGGVKFIKEANDYLLDNLLRNVTKGIKETIRY